ncbi:carboxypeptidase regulatory-like domain protein, partial [Leptospira interrogans serovar Grippotyphosa str. LT2186]
MKKQLYYYFRIFLFSILISPISILALDVTLTGIVKDKNGNSISNVKIIVQESRKTTITNEKGEFVLNHVPPGKYTLVAISRGYQSETISITIGEKDEKTQFTLLESSLDQSAINVTA